MKLREVAILLFIFAFVLSLGVNMYQAHVIFELRIIAKDNHNKLIKAQESQKKCVDTLEESNEVLGKTLGLIEKRAK